MVYIYISSHIFYPLGKCHHYSWFRCFSGRCWDNSGEFFQEVASAQQQNWIQLRRMMRQQGRYHCGWWPMVKLSRSKRCAARNGSLSAGDKRVEYQWIASRNQRWKWNSTRSEFRDYCPIFSMYIFRYFPIFSYMFLLRMVFSMGASFCHLFWQLCESMHGRCHKNRCREDSRGCRQCTRTHRRWADCLISWRTLDSQSLWRSCRAGFDC